MIVPLQQLSEQALTNIVKEFVLREGTDYGEFEKSLEQKEAEVLAQLKAGSVVIVYSEEYETVDIHPADKYPQS